MPFLPAPLAPLAWQLLPGHPAVAGLPVGTPIAVDAVPWVTLTDELGTYLVCLSEMVWTGIIALVSVACLFFPYKVWPGKVGINGCATVSFLARSGALNIARAHEKNVKLSKLTAGSPGYVQLVMEMMLTQMRNWQLTKRFDRVLLRPSESGLTQRFCIVLPLTIDFLC